MLSRFPSTSRMYQRRCGGWHMRSHSELMTGMRHWGTEACRYASFFWSKRPKSLLCLWTGKGLHILHWHRMNAQGRKIENASEPPNVSRAPVGIALHAAGDNDKCRTIISNSGNSQIEVLHRDSDPSTWIVRRWKKFLWFKKRISSDWFSNREHAFAYAYETKKKVMDLRKLRIMENRRNAPWSSVCETPEENFTPL